MSLITVAQANDHLRLDLENDGSSPPNFDDPRVPELQLKMDEATDAVLDYLKVGQDSPPLWDDETVPPRVRAAILLVLTSLYDDRAAGEMLAGLSGGDLKNPVVALLYRLRDPAMA
jgi:hypothetical protein